MVEPLSDIFDLLKSKFSCPSNQIERVYDDLKRLGLDRAIGMNTAFCLVAFVGLVGLYSLGKWLWNYIYHCKSYYNSNKFPSYSLWSICFSFGLADRELVNHIGLDCYLFLQTHRLCFSLVIVMFFLTCPVITIPLLIRKLDSAQIFLSLSVLNVDKNSWAWSFVVACMWIYVFYAMHALEEFYKLNVELRQEFLARPTGLMPIEVVDSVRVCQSTFCGEAEPLSPSAYKQLFDIAACTVIAKRLPKSITNNEQLMEYVSGLHLGNVKCVTLVEASEDYLKLLVEKRENAVIELETAYSQLLANVCAKIEASLKGTNSFGTGQQSSSATLSEGAQQPTATTLHSWCASFYAYSQMSTEEKLALVERINQDHSAAFEQCRPKTFSLRSCKRQDSIACCLQRIEEIDRQLMQLKLEYSEREQQPPTVEAIAAEQLQRQLSGSEEEPSERMRFYSIGPMMIYPFGAACLSFFTKLQTRKSAIITFSDRQEASLAKQCLIEQASINTKFVTAPPPTDIVWSNLGVFSTARIKPLLCKLSYLTIVLMYSVPIGIIAFFTERLFVQGFFREYFGWETSQWKWFAPLWEGLVAPAFLSAFIAIVPMALNGIAVSKGYISRSSISCHSANMYNWFLFLQPFLFTLISSSFFVFLKSIANGEYCHLMIDFQSTLLKKSSFFMNFIIQRMTIDMGLLLVRFPDLIFKWALFSPRGSPRKAANDLAPVPFPFSHTFPKVVAVFPVTIIYGTISPAILAVGSCYYFVSYVVHCYSLLNVFSHTAESGGMYWKSNFRVIMYSIILCCVATFIQLVLSGYFVKAILLIPLMVGLVMRGNKLEQTYSPFLDGVPLKQRKDGHPDAFVPAAARAREEMEQIYATSTTATARPFLLGESVKRACKLNQREMAGEYYARWLNLPNFYSCPISFEKEVEVMFVDGFFEVMKYWYEIYLVAQPGEGVVEARLSGLSEELPV